MGVASSSDGSFSPFLNYLSFSPRVLRRPTDSLAPRSMFPCIGLLCSSVFSLCSFPSISPLVSPLDTRWSVLWLTVLQGSCQWFVLREPAGLAFSFSDSGLRPFSLPLFHPELRSVALFLWSSFLVSCGTGWASISGDNL